MPPNRRSKLDKAAANESHSSQEPLHHHLRLLTITPTHNPGTIRPSSSAVSDTCLIRGKEAPPPASPKPIIPPPIIKTTLANSPVDPVRSRYITNVKGLEKLRKTLNHSKGQNDRLCGKLQNIETIILPLLLHSRKNWIKTRGRGTRCRKEAVKCGRALLEGRISEKALVAEIEKDEKTMVEKGQKLVEWRRPAGAKRWTEL